MTVTRSRLAVLPPVALAAFTFAWAELQPRAQSAPSSLDALARQSLARIDGELRVSGLKQPVEIIRDRQGIPHIYARNDDDLFFAQGYVMAQDRLWQLEMWRRWREGRLAEIFGPKAFDYDARARLMMFRGPWDDAEWKSYHKDAERLFTAWAKGLNAYVEENASNLPVEFKLTGIRPEPWTARTLTLRWAPVTGDPTRDTASRTKIDEYTFEIISKKAGKVVSTNRATASRDGKTITQTPRRTNARGVKFSNTVVGEK